MFVVTFEDGTTAIQGVKGIKTWDDVPRDKKISAITLTDGGDIIETLSSCDFYVVEYVGKHSVSSSGLMKETRVIGRPKTFAQVVTGIRDMTANRSLIRKIGNKLIHEVNSAYDDIMDKNLLFAKARANEISSLSEKIKEMVAKVDDIEVVQLRMGLTMTQTSRDTVKTKQEAFREGTGSELLDTNEITKRLKPVNTKE